MEYPYHLTDVNGAFSNEVIVPQSRSKNRLETNREWRSLNFKMKDLLCAKSFICDRNMEIKELSLSFTCSPFNYRYLAALWVFRNNLELERKCWTKLGFEVDPGSTQAGRPTQRPKRVDPRIWVDPWIDQKNWVDPYFWVDPRVDPIFSVDPRVDQLFRVDPWINPKNRVDSWLFYKIFWIF